MKIKKHSIGYNTVTSVDGIISTRGVKSKPNNIRIFGYTHEIGEGEKSPDNSYQLVSLDSGAMTVDGVDYEHSIKLNNSGKTIQVPTPIAFSSVEGVSDYIYKDDDGDWKLNQKCQKYEFTGKENFTIQSINTFGIANFITSDLKYKRFSLCVCSHLEQQNTTISNTKNEGIYPVETSSLYLRIHQNRCSTVDALKTYLTEQYHLNVAITLAYYLYTPITHVLSDYAQDLLNSFVLENKNNISVEGNPDIKITGYLQK